MSQVHSLYARWEWAWNVLVQRGGVTPYSPNAMRLFEKIIHAYREPHRWYHGIDHLVFVINQIEQVASFDPAPFPRTISRVKDHEEAVATIAAFYHDFIYDMKPYAEQRSSEAMSIDLAPSPICLSDIKRIAHCIRNTTNLGIASSAPVEVKILHDADVAILSAPWSVYYQYQLNIWKEYGIIEDERWHPNSFLRLRFFEGRRKFLMNAIDQIHYSEYRPENVTDEQAKKNMRKEISNIEELIQNTWRPKHDTQ